METHTDLPGGTEGERLWCSVCETVHRAEAWDVGVRTCPACGGTGRDARTWGGVRDLHPAYPERPEEGARYPWNPSNPAGSEAAG